MPNYEVKVTATWWVNLEADNEEDAEKTAWDTFLDDGHYDGVDEIKVFASDDEEEDEEDE